VSHNICECEALTKVSLKPCKIKVGHETFAIASTFLNLSAIKN
jgi:hypothetical protein